MREGDLVGGRYRLNAPLGRGGMGQVFRATDERLRRDVAIKVVDLTQTHDATLAERFHREAIATARLNHPRIVTIFDAGADERIAWIVMELLPGRPVSQVLHESGRLPEASAVRIARGVAEALVATHAIGVVHRDIKPANIMVDGDAVKLLDFGIALVKLDAEAHLTAPATTLGTAAYMAPEQAQGQRATSASDVYALGGVLVAMVTGQPPYPGENPLQVSHRHLSEPPPSLRARRPEVSPALDDLVRRMMAKDPSARPPASVVAQAFAHLESNPAADPTTVLPAAAAAAASVPPAAASVLPPATAVLPSAAPPPNATSVMPAATAVLPNAAGGPPPGSARRTVTGPDQGRGVGAPDPNRFRRVGAWIALFIAAVLVFAIAWAIGSSVFSTGTATPSPRPSASATGSPRTANPTTTRPRTTAPRSVAPSTTAPRSTAPQTPPNVSLPSIGVPTLPSGREAAVRAAIAGVDATLGAIPGGSQGKDKALDKLASTWDKARDDILEDKQPARAVERMRDEIDQQRDEGVLSAIEAQGLKLALSAVEAAV